jgi:hypothetical protein
MYIQSLLLHRSIKHTSSFDNFLSPSRAIAGYLKKRGCSILVKSWAKIHRPVGGSLQVRVLTHASNLETLVPKAKRYSRLRLRIINHPYSVACKRLISGIPITSEAQTKKSIADIGISAPSAKLI